MPVSEAPKKDVSSEPRLQCFVSLGILGKSCKQKATCKALRERDKGLWEGFWL